MKILSENCNKLQQITILGLFIGLMTITAAVFLDLNAKRKGMKMLAIFIPSTMLRWVRHYDVKTLRELLLIFDRYLVIIIVIIGSGDHLVDRNCEVSGSVSNQEEISFGKYFGSDQTCLAATQFEGSLDVFLID